MSPDSESVGSGPGEGLERETKDNFDRRGRSAQRGKKNGCGGIVQRSDLRSEARRVETVGEKCICSATPCARLRSKRSKWRVARIGPPLRMDLKHEGGDTAYRGVNSLHLPGKQARE